jgi:hypothetical protein
MAHGRRTDDASSNGRSVPEHRCACICLTRSLLSINVEMRWLYLRESCEERHTS